MNTYTINTRSIRWAAVSIAAPILGHHEKTGAPILGLPQMDDAQWEALAKEKGGKAV